MDATADSAKPYELGYEHGFKAGWDGEEYGEFLNVEYQDDEDYMAGYAVGYEDGFEDGGEGEPIDADDLSEDEMPDELFLGHDDMEG